MRRADWLDIAYGIAVGCLVGGVFAAVMLLRDRAS